MRYNTFMTKIGIDDMGFYVPPLMMSVEKLVQERSREFPELAEKLQNAIKTTGQRFIRFTKKWQDSVTLAAEAVLAMAKSVSFETLKLIISATETSVDGSKPISAFLIGILQKSGIKVPEHLLNYQTQHACAAGAISILQAIAMIRSLGGNKSAIVTASDVARYSKSTTAEITQGSGGVALHICENPRLLELEPDAAGCYSSDVDDFFRPVSRTEASVKGQFSMKCYNIAVCGALEDLAQQRGVSLAELLESSDYIVFHVPFYSMPFTALRYILRTKLGYTHEQYDKFIEAKHIPDSGEIISLIGNTYTASMFFALGGLLDKVRRGGNSVGGKNVLIVSYGSGNTALAMRGRTAASADAVVDSWNLFSRLSHGQENAEAYEAWMKNSCVMCADAPGDDAAADSAVGAASGPVSVSGPETDAEKAVYLKELREGDQYRVYDVS